VDVGPTAGVRFVGLDDLVDAIVVISNRLVQLVVDEFDPPAQGVVGKGGRPLRAGRRFFVTSLLRKGVAPHIVQALARHRDARTTLQVCAHADYQDLRAAVN